MSADETPHPSTGLPSEPDAKSSLDELLDYVRDHLDDSPAEDDDIPVLNDVIVAASPSAVIESSNTNQPVEYDDADTSYLDLDASTPPFSPVDTAEPVNSNYSTSSATQNLDHSAEETLDLTQVVSDATQQFAPTDKGDGSDLTPLFADAVTPAAPAHEQAHEQSDQPDGPAPITFSPSPTQENTESGATSHPADMDEAAWDDDAEKFDATQVAWMDDDLSAAHAVVPMPRANEHSTGGTFQPGHENANPQNVTKNEDGGLQETIITTTLTGDSSITGLSKAAIEDQPFDGSQIPEDWLNYFDQVINERCSALAEELKRQLREPVAFDGSSTIELADRSTNLDPPA